MVQDLSHQECQLVGVFAGGRDTDGARPVPVQVAQLEGQPGDREGIGIAGNGDGSSPRALPVSLSLAGMRFGIAGNGDVHLLPGVLGMG